MTKNELHTDQGPPMDLLYFLVAIASMAALHFQYRVGIVLPLPWNLIGVIPLAIGIAVHLAGRRALNAHGTTTRHSGEPTVLVTDGVYGKVKHPMNLGLLLMILGASMLYGSLVTYLVVALAASVLGIKSLYLEEKQLQTKFGSAWREYVGTPPVDARLPDGASQAKGRSRRQELWLAALLFILPLVIQVILGEEGFSKSWTLSGYYREVIMWTMIGLVALACLAGPARRHETLRGLIRLILAPVPFVAGLVLAVVVDMPIGPPIPNFREPAVYSPSRDMYYIVAEEQPPYGDGGLRLHFFGMERSQWNPVWTYERKNVLAGKPPSGYDSGPMSLVLSKDEKLLAVRRGETYSDVIMLDSGKHYRQDTAPRSTSGPAGHRDGISQAPDPIKDLLDKHGGEKD